MVQKIITLSINNSYTRNDNQSNHSSRQDWQWKHMHSQQKDVLWSELSVWLMMMIQFPIRKLDWEYLKCKDNTRDNALHQRLLMFYFYAQFCINHNLTLISLCSVWSKQTSTICRSTCWCLQVQVLSPHGQQSSNPCLWQHPLRAHTQEHGTLATSCQCSADNGRSALWSTTRSHHPLRHRQWEDAQGEAAPLCNTHSTSLPGGGASGDPGALSTQRWVFRSSTFSQAPHPTSRPRVGWGAFER